MFKSKNDFKSHKIIFKVKNKISNLKPFRFFIKHSFFDSNIDFFYQNDTIHGVKLYISIKDFKIISKTIIFHKMFNQKCHVFLPKKCFTSDNQIFHKEKPMSTTIPIPENQWLY